MIDRFLDKAMAFLFKHPMSLTIAQWIANAILAAAAFINLWIGNTWIACATFFWTGIMTAISALATSHARYMVRLQSAIHATERATERMDVAVAQMQEAVDSGRVEVVEVSRGGDHVTRH